MPGWVPNDHILIGKEEQIHIHPYNPVWPSMFEKEKKLVETTLKEWIIGGVHHVGSTSIPGISAKPIIDIMVGVNNLEKAQACIPLLDTIHYSFFPYKPEYMHWFCKPSLEHRTHHLYLMEPTSNEWRARLAFRDYLRSHPQEKREYETLKKKLAEQFIDDREGYTDAKTEYIKKIVKKSSATPL